MMPLRVCVACGLEANTEADLSLFVRNKPSAFEYANRCKSCQKAESRMRRAGQLIEIFKARGSDGLIHCYFCGKIIMKLEGYGSDALHIHSLDENHENWNPANKFPVHNICHVKHHRIGNKNPNWKGDKASDSAKRKRVMAK